MTAKPVIPRARAHADVDLAVEYYADEAGADVAADFIDALEQAYTFIGEMPAAGSTRWAHDLNLPGLRTIGLKRFPWLVFYLEFETHVDVWRVLHARLDMPAWLTDVDD
ncbi:plasmid stabilization protein [Erythrobacter sp. SG61-1L]|uniref:type II toxin-antitoxin system RelE/ParE family toxin n=1 Tax=Erythrobacter sp. SG61-1L TaxID=1603897 RepID=UPI0006C903A1|nr:type II toxin-antitoxin system RelE/ParE family toxin [Erythrobacter sp. SG61-1L]KPL68486.1 plasmid stabilization protein [Erythrobacter sp. SG61-1L]